MIDIKAVNKEFHAFHDFIRYLQSKDNTFTEDYDASSLIDELSPSWYDLARDLRYKQGDLILIQAFNEIGVEDRHRLKSKAKLKMKAKVNLTNKSQIFRTY